jgi:hypothetical protein
MLQRFPSTNLDNQVIYHADITSDAFPVAAFLTLSDVLTYMKREHDLGSRCTFAYGGFVTNLDHESAFEAFLDARRVIEGRGAVALQKAA